MPGAYVCVELSTIVTTLVKSNGVHRSRGAVVRRVKSSKTRETATVNNATRERNMGHGSTCSVITLRVACAPLYDAVKRAVYKTVKS